MSKYERVVRIGKINTETGVFPATLATESEASDGHILSIEGMRVPVRMPLLPRHWDDPSAVLGSLTEPQKALSEKPARLRASGQIEMDGKGVPLEVRQDLAHMIDKGHVTGMSIRWDEVEGHPPVRRVNLPSDHPFFVDEAKEKNSRKRWGLYFEHSQALEGSIVALGADKKALIGRADETTGAVSAFYRSMAEHTEEPEPDRELEDARLGFGLNIGPDPGSMPAPEADAAAAVSALRIQVNDCREAGVDAREMCEAFVGSLAEKEAESIRVVFRAGTSVEPTEEDHARLAEIVEDAESSARAIGVLRSERVDLKTRLEAAEAALKEAKPEPDQVTAPEAKADQPSPLHLDPKDIRQPFDAQALGRLMSDMLDQADERRRRMVQQMIDLAKGKVT